MQSSRPDRIRKLLADLVGFDTISDRSNLPLIAHIESYLATLGVKGERITDETGQKTSLWVTIGPEDRPGLVLSGHTDVVPVVGQDWSHDPFKLVERDGKLYGRGTTDMKGFVAVCLAMVPEMLEAKLATPIHLAISYDEEIGCVGVRPIRSAESISRRSSTIPRSTRRPMRQSSRWPRASRGATTTPRSRSAPRQACSPAWPISRPS
jgi:acetylornithine deacetylase